MEFIQAIWPDFTEASLSLFTEETLLRDAINLIRKLRAVEVATREAQDNGCLCGYSPCRVWTALSALDDPHG
jgi:hypothetical protein